jgi:hypothetical protein
VATVRHLALIEQLAANSDARWGKQALLACLEKLRDGGPTEAAIVDVYDAWPLDDGFKIVYLSPWGPKVGLTARRGRLEFFMDVYVEDAEAELTPKQFGDEVADFFVAEPLGNRVDFLDYDADGLGWWGERTLS